MDNDRHRKNGAVNIKIESEQEPVECVGNYTEADDGFVLTFSIGENRYEVVRAARKTVMRASGLLTYDFDYGCKKTLELDTPFGKLDYEFDPVEDRLEETDGGFKLCLSHTLFNKQTGNIARNVTLHVAFVSETDKEKK